MKSPWREHTERACVHPVGCLDLNISLACIMKPETARTQEARETLPPTKVRKIPILSLHFRILDDPKKDSLVWSSFGALPWLCPILTNGLRWSDEADVRFFSLERSETIICLRCRRSLLAKSKARLANQLRQAFVRSLSAMMADRFSKRLFAF